MDKLPQKMVTKFNDFLVKISYGLEGFKYEGKIIGPAVLLINFIEANPNCTMSDVCGFLQVIPSTATRRINKLVDLELVERSIGSDDRRSIILTLTAQGKKMYLHFLEKRFQGLDQLLKMYSEEKIENFLSILDFLSDYSDKFMEN